MKFELKDSLYETLIVCARDYKSVKVNLKKGNLIVDKTKRFVIDHKQIYGIAGINPSDLKEIGIENCIEDPWHVLEMLYERYKYSVTNKDIKKPYFKALKKDELTDANIINGEDRYIARCMLEGYVVLASANGILQWPDDDLWFWQSETDPDLIVLKEWIKQEDK